MSAVLVAYTVVVLPFRAAFFWEYYMQVGSCWLRMAGGHLQARLIWLVSCSWTCTTIFGSNCRCAALSAEWPGSEPSTTLAPRCLRPCCSQVDWMLSTDLLVDIWLLADIALNFQTGVIVEQVRLCRLVVADSQQLPGTACPACATGARCACWRIPRLCSTALAAGPQLKMIPWVSLASSAEDCKTLDKAGQIAKRILLSDVDLQIKQVALDVVTPQSP